MRDPTHTTDLDLGRQWPLILFGRPAPKRAQLPAPRSIERGGHKSLATLRVLSKTVQFYLRLFPRPRPRSPANPPPLPEFSTLECPTLSTCPPPAARVRAAAPRVAARTSPPPIPKDALSVDRVEPLEGPPPERQWPAGRILLASAALAGLVVAALIFAIKTQRPPDTAAPRVPAQTPAVAEQKIAIEVKPARAAAPLHPTVVDDLASEPAAEAPPSPTLKRAPVRRAPQRRAHRPRPAAAEDEILAAAVAPRPKPRVDAEELLLLGAK